jgi:hypothetical protein
MYEQEIEPLSIASIDGAVKRPVYGRVGIEYYVAKGHSSEFAS